MINERVLPFAGIHNFRDYGGYAAGDGGRLKRQVLLRSGQHIHATAEDLAQLAALRLRTIVDLRGNGERAAWPCARHEGFGARVLFFDGETSGTHSPSEVAAARRIITPADADAAMIGIYRRMPYLPGLQSVLRDYFITLATDDGPTLLHCFAGKDRTGFGVALLHQLVGVHPDDMMADYLMTNSVGNAEAWIAAGEESIRRSHGRQISDGAIRILMSAEPAYLDAALNAVREQHGSVFAYVRDALGLNMEWLTSLRRQLVA